MADKKQLAIEEEFGKIPFLILLFSFLLLFPSVVSADSPRVAFKVGDPTYIHNLVAASNTAGPIPTPKLAPGLAFLASPGNINNDGRADTTDPRLALTNITNIPGPVSIITTSGTPKAPLSSGLPGNPNDWILTFDEEFNGTSLDGAKWITKYPFANHQDDGTDDGDRSNNQESEWYVDNAFTFNSGVMSINAKYECLASGRQERYAPYSCARFPYTSGLIASASSFSQRYGYFEARLKIPSADGFWPTFWLLPKNSPQPAAMPWSVSLWPPEIDIMENFSHDLTAIRLSNIYSNIYPNPGTTGDYRSLGGFDYDTHFGPDYSQAFHTFGVDWEPGFVAWYIDGVEVRRVITNIPPGTPPNGSYDGMFILVNLAVSTGNGNISLPNPLSLPKTLDVDYVRVYQGKPSFPPELFLPYVAR